MNGQDSCTVQQRIQDKLKDQNQNGTVVLTLVWIDEDRIWVPHAVAMLGARSYQAMSCCVAIP
eukprot:4316915-Amphidinium_carterae.1